MRALSIRQPWADLILYAGKNIEKRTWRFPDKHKGERILIHAGKQPDQSGLARLDTLNGFQDTQARRHDSSAK